VRVEPGVDVRAAGQSKMTWMSCVFSMSAAKRRMRCSRSRSESRSGLIAQTTSLIASISPTRSRIT
jgi:hypothetical protein